MGVSQIRIRVPDEVLELEAIERYRRHLTSMVTYPELYESNYHLWEKMVKGALRHPTNEKIDWAAMGRYEEVRGTTQHNLDWFMLNQDGWNSLGRDAWTRLFSLDTEETMEMFGVDRSTALMIRSVHHRKVMLEPEWEKVK